MQTYHIKLQSEVFKTFRCVRAANSLDIDPEKKSIHELSITADIKTDFKIGLILGASGSGKTTLTKAIFGGDCFNIELDPEKPIIDQLPKELSYDECAEILSGIGLTSVPCWIRPVKTLSNGQRARAEAALAMTLNKELTLIDEWTSVVDRTVAKVMSHCIQKFAKKRNKRIILLSCHYDVIEWLNPDWIIDCNEQKFIDRRLLSPEDRKRKERLQFQIRKTDKSSWRSFSKYHYLSDKVSGGLNLFYGLFQDSDQIGFIAYSNYLPWKDKTKKMCLHSNRIVIHPDYQGLGLGLHLLNETSKLIQKQYQLRIKMSSISMYKSLIKDSKWKLVDNTIQIGMTAVGNRTHERGRTTSSFRENVKTWTFQRVQD